MDESSISDAEEPTDMILGVKNQIQRIEVRESSQDLAMHMIKQWSQKSDPDVKKTYRVRSETDLKYKFPVGNAQFPNGNDQFPKGNAPQWIEL